MIVARTSLDLDELVEHWTLLKDEQGLVSGKRGATRLGFAVLLKFYRQYGRFPRGRFELPGEAVEFVARQVQVPASELGTYEWTGRTIEYHRAQIRGYLGFRECSVVDADKLTAWLAEHVACKERRPEQVRVELLARCRTECIEPPSAGRCDRIVAAALRAAEEMLTARISARLTVESTERIVALVAGADQEDNVGAGEGAAGEGEDEPSVLGKIKEAPGNVSLETMLTEIDKLLAVRAIGLPPDLFADVAPKVVAGWRARAAVESPTHLRTHPLPLRVTLLHEREREITDTLVELLISTVHRIGARAEKKVTEQLVNAFKKVSGKENILFKLAEASLTEPEGTVREVVYPAVSGGEQTQQELVHEFKTRGPVYRRTVQTTLKASYTNHYRRGLIKLLDVLEFRPHPPAGDRGPGPGGPVRGGGQHHVLPAGRDRAGAQGDGRGLGGGRPPHRQARPAPRGAHGLRGRRLPGPARPAQVQGDLGRRRR
ncbi:DUF4158 domain-containing protein [Streptomyces inhibens]|uniref:DUF4158 domain-containing protein n=1 Tax=Streptomyces inhibens TaxID=2293571 RepID=UPI001EE75969|nr:DUF4158 domain-containing protein [Streptomyces inhibens]UKY47840.1 DUF4158 domain-containing protein [Streptomyces inhibens]